ncbi:MAG: thioredoxin fold domain-containing protein [Gammaproteobacteria bacterium]|nr:thioredoxin fold domain-containing protein [Gammaproteobacteria bacterium]
MQKTNKCYIESSLQDFSGKALDASHNQPVLVDFWADWCSPCLVIAPVLEKVAREYQKELLLVKVEVDEGENMKLAGRYKLRGFPTVMLFMDGKEAGRFSGAKPYNEIKRFLDKYIPQVP